MNKQEIFSAVLEKYKDAPESQYEDMSINELCEHRQSVSRQLKKLEEERKSIDETIMDSLSEVELKHGINLKSGSCIKMRSRTSYKYPQDIDIEISNLRRHAREQGDAQMETSTYLVLI